MSGMVSQRMDPLVKLRRPGKGEGDGKANRQSHPGEAMEGAAKSQRALDAHLIKCGALPKARKDK